MPAPGVQARVFGMRSDGTLARWRACVQTRHAESQRSAPRLPRVVLPRTTLEDLAYTILRTKAALFLAYASAAHHRDVRAFHATRTAHGSPASVSALFHRAKTAPLLPLACIGHSFDLALFTYFLSNWPLNRPGKSWNFEHLFNKFVHLEFCIVVKFCIRL